MNNKKKKNKKEQETSFLKVAVVNVCNIVKRRKFGVFFC